MTKLNFNETIMQEATNLAIDNIKNGGGPFAAIIVKDKKIIGKGVNRVTDSNDPTAHAEINAIRNACKNIASFQLNGCELYTTCEPCPMCLGAIYWARFDKVYFGSSKNDAAKVGFDDAFIYKEIDIEHTERKITFNQISPTETANIFDFWQNYNDKTAY